jgi:hypothetical protein
MALPGWEGGDALRVGIVGAVIIVAGALAGCSSSSTPPSPAAPEGSTGGDAQVVADAVVLDITAERNDEVVAVMAPEAKATLTASRLKSVWAAAVGANGAYGSHGSPVHASTSGYELFDYPLTFERGKAHLQIAVNKQGLVTGLYPRPGDPTGTFGK